MDEKVPPSSYTFDLTEVKSMLKPATGDLLLQILIRQQMPAASKNWSASSQPVMPRCCSTGEKPGAC